MCGICGMIRYSGEPVERHELERMCTALEHRGPDGLGISAGPGIGLAQRRLAIIDLDPRGIAPLFNEDHSVQVTFNGEIYNFPALRDTLLARGHVFRTGTDTEVLVHLYEEYGDRCVEHLRGMFAFALWDANERRLLAARDRLGKKPFVYAASAEGFVFASEVPALLESGLVAREPDFGAIDLFLQHQYVPSPFTGIRGVRKLGAGQLLTVDARRRTVSIRQYWRPPAPAPTSLSREEAERELVARMREAVRCRLLADVPVGAFLSGGIDSASVVALMAEESGRSVRTFTIGFEGASHDERPYAREVARRYGTDHHEFVVRARAAEVLPELVRRYGEPFADSSALPTYYLSRETRRHVTVALSGDGGDESFAGYDAYAAIARWSRADALPRPVRRTVARGVAGTLARLPYGNTRARFTRAAAMLGGNLPERYALHMSIFKPEERRAAYTAELRSRIAEAWRAEEPMAAAVAVEEPAVPDGTRRAAALDWMMRHDQAHYLPDCLMMKVDIASMAHGLEVRCPLLDHELVTFAASLPAQWKRNGGGGKLVLRSAMRSFLPQALLDKPKTGFGIPAAHWLRTELRDMATDLLTGDRAVARGWFDPRWIARRLDEHWRQARDWSTRIWALMCLELWLREVMRYE